MSLPKRNERSMMIPILRTLNSMPDTFAWETDTKGTGFKDRAGNQRYLHTLSRGKADIVVCHMGLCAAIEVKMPGKKLAPHQELWRQDFMRGKGLHFVVHDTYETEEAWKKLHARVFSCQV